MADGKAEGALTRCGLGSKNMLRNCSIAIGQPPARACFTRNEARERAKESLAGMKACDM